MGKVYLIGAGPGDVGLLTVKGLALLKEADVVVYDYLANPSLLKNCKPSCECLYVGKKAANHTMTQEDINLLLVEKATEQKVVVRLKGGDPYVFGRGGEEAAVLRKSGISFEVVPGVTSAIGGLAYAGIPVTHRHVATSFHVVTGHLSKETMASEFVQLELLAKIKGTLVFLMGMGQIETITQQLIVGGRNPETPAAIVYSASLPNQEVLIGTLSTIASLSKGASHPGLIVIGEVVALRETLNFFSERPLYGKKIIVTRAADQNSKTIEKLQALGAEVLEWPTIEIEPIQESPLKEKLNALNRYTYVVFTSQNAVHIFFKALKAIKLDARALGHIKVGAIGATTEAVLGTYGIVADVCATTYDAQAFALALKKSLNKEDVVFVPRSAGGEPDLIHSLQEICQVEELHIYQTVPVDLPLEQVKTELALADAVLFTSGSTVNSFVSQLQIHQLKPPEHMKWCSIGPVTSSKIRDLGFCVDVEAQVHTIDGLIEATTQLLVNKVELN